MAMAPLFLQLPAEVWAHVFGFLPVADRLKTRATCKYFQKLIDNRTLWKDYILQLTFPNGTYNKRFWSTVRSWKVSSAVVRSFQAKQWSELATELPDLATILVLNVCASAFDCLKHFTNLTRLHFEGCTTPFNLDTLRTVSPGLTHLSFCAVPFTSISFDAFVLTLSQFTNLESLIFHKTIFREEPVQIIHRIASSLPKLTHLSLAANYLTLGQNSNLEPLQNASLTSLEIVNYKADVLPENMMTLLPNLKSLAVFYLFQPTHQCHLATWLNDLPNLSTLVVDSGPRLEEYIHSIPTTLTSIAISHALKDDNEKPGFLIHIQKRAPNLQHLHLDLSRRQRTQLTQLIPDIFDKLQVLKVRHENVPDTDFLKLAEMKELRCLELLDSVPPPSELVDKFKEISKNRIKICKRQSDPMRCTCVSYVY